MLDSLVPSILTAAEPAAKPEARALAPKNPKAGKASAEAAVYAREDLAIRFESRDGDVVEVRRSVTVAAAYGRGAARPGRGDASELAGDDYSRLCGHGKGGASDADGADGTGPSEGREGMLSDTLKWMREVSRELEKQQARLIESLLKGKDKDGDSSGGFVMYSILLAKAGVDPEAEVAETDEDYGVPEYWNAENTSDRIVAFATSFAGIFGDDPGFAETMVNAVAEGFAQADAILGELPGKAGKLNRDTRDKVFEKLDIWLEAWKSGAYNHGAQPKALEPALSA